MVIKTHTWFLPGQFNMITATSPWDRLVANSSFLKKKSKLLSPYFVQAFIDTLFAGFGCLDHKLLRKIVQFGLSEDFCWSLHCIWVCKNAFEAKA